MSVLTEINEIISVSSQNLLQYRKAELYIDCNLRNYGSVSFQAAHLPCA